jgi:hypothetical protein
MYNFLLTPWLKLYCMKVTRIIMYAALFCALGIDGNCQEEEGGFSQSRE